MHYCMGDVRTSALFLVRREREDVLAALGPRSRTRFRRRFDYGMRVTRTAGDGRKEGAKCIKTYSPSNST